MAPSFPRRASVKTQAGKRHGAGSTPGAYSETISPVAAMRRREAGCRGRYEPEAPRPEPGEVAVRVEAPQVTGPARARRRAHEVRTCLGGEDRQRQLGHAASSCGAR